MHVHWCILHLRDPHEPRKEGQLLQVQLHLLEGAALLSIVMLQESSEAHIV